MLPPPISKSYRRSLKLNLVSGRLVEKPNDVVVPPGTKAVLRCSTNLSHSVDWHRRSNDGSKHEIYSNGQISPSFSSQYAVGKQSEQSDIGVYNLEIFSIAKIHEGNYTCIDNEGLGPDVASANLQILSTVTEGTATLQLDNRIPVAEHQKNEQARTLQEAMTTSPTTNRDSSTSVNTRELTEIVNSLSPVVLASVVVVDSSIIIIVIPVITVAIWRIAHRKDCIVLLLIWNLRSIDAEIVEKPDNLTARCGESVTMKCSTNMTKPVDWQFIYSIGDPEEVYSDGSLSPKFSQAYRIDTNRRRGAYDLVITNAIQENSGKYICIDNSGSEASATLKVIPPTTDNRIPVAEHQKNEQGRTLENEITTSLTTNSDSSTSPLDAFEFNETVNSLNPVVLAPVVVGLSLGLVIAFLVVVVAVRRIRHRKVYCNGERCNSKSSNPKFLCCGSRRRGKDEAHADERMATVDLIA